MALHTFKGGVHPFDGKEYSKDMPIRELKPGKELVFLMSQHIGAPAKACVKKGDRVFIASEEAAIRAMEPQAENVWAPAGGEPVIIRVKEGLY